MAEEPEGMEADVVVEDMDQTSLTSSAPTSVIVNVTGENATGDSDMDRTASPISQ
ncbi:hypothetical protein GBAR_LOCUS22735 [Geodia barretti]|uniref:Uncharacterized protein n=1 Tax=Geodia barretti TaxID=519541 RepID=A0AA35T5S8_GEOBA|nr:hypothetical protein GBAR_LOCUS22735 [Geodia barretti]